MKIFLYVIVFMLILCPIRSYAVEVGPDFNGIRLGTNINNPIINAPIANTSTALAETSLAFLALSSILGIAISTTVSIAVLNNSPPITRENKLIQISNSINVIRKRKPNIITKNITEICIFKFLSVLKALNIPVNAYLKLLINFLFFILLFPSINSLLLTFIYNIKYEIDIKKPANTSLV